jgi:hypothetical protein
MQISQRQWDRIGRVSFEQRLIGVIRNFHPGRAAALDDAQLGAEINRQLRRATAYGLADERSAATYVHAAWLLGPEFDQRIPGIRQILVDPQIPAAGKAAALNDFSHLVFAALSPSGAARGEHG